MGSRCKACNRPLNYGSLYMKNKFTGEPEDLCGICRDKSNQEYSVLYDHSYEHMTITEGLAGVGREGYYYDFYD